MVSRIAPAQNVIPAVSERSCSVLRFHHFPAI